MGKTIKRLLIASLVFLTLGMILCVVSVAAGVDYRKVNFGNRHHTEVEQIDQTFTESVTKLDINICFGEFNLKKGDSFRLVGENIPKDTLRFSVENGTLKIEEEQKEVIGINFSLFGINFDGDDWDKKITLYVPANVSLDSFEFDMNAGTSRIEDLTAKTAKIDMDAGKFVANRITVSEQATLNMDAGKMDLKEATLTNSNLEVNAGKFSADGTFYGETTATVSAGAMELNTSLKESEYDYTTSVSAGSVKINGDSCNDKNRDNNASNSFDLDCSAGSIEVKTK